MSSKLIPVLGITRGSAVRHCDHVHGRRMMKPEMLLSSVVESEMTNPQPKNSFSWGDALFLYLERPGQPLSIASACIFEGKVSLKACRDLVESKLPLIPRYRQHVVFPPFNLGLPNWQFDPNFDIRDHIRKVVLRNGTDADFKELTSSIVSTHLDRQKPLWDITLVHGLEGNRTGMIARIHHCLADGMAGLGIMNVLMDPSPVVQPIQKTKTEFRAPHPRDAGAALLDGLVKSYFSAVKGALTLHSEAVSLAQGILAKSADSLANIVEIMPELATPADRLPFNVVCHGPQKFGWTEISMDDVRMIRERCGGTVNDVLLTVVAAALRRYSELRRVRVTGRSARIMIPVNVRSGDAVSDLGNRISFLPVTIPLNIRDPQKLFKFVRERTEHLKRMRAAELVGFTGGLFSAIPTPILAAIAPVASQLPLSLCNIICTNIPGPQMPLYLLGHKLESWYPYVPIGGEMGFNCAILSYNGKAYFGFTCDVGALPDPESVEEFVDASFAELCASAKRVKLQVGESKAVERASEATGRRKSRRAKRTLPLSKAMAKAATTQARKKLVRHAKIVAPVVSPEQTEAPKQLAESSTSSPKITDFDLSAAAPDVSARRAAVSARAAEDAPAPALGLVGD